eukprot:Amastigsp_a843951_62.p3 type:complete len:109 gc:universal Amastigsp_a843951_62:604-278(-)
MHRAAPALWGDDRRQARGRAWAVEHCRHPRGSVSSPRERNGDGVPLEDREPQGRGAESRHSDCRCGPRRACARRLAPSRCGRHRRGHEHPRRPVQESRVPVCRRCLLC